MAFASLRPGLLAAALLLALAACESQPFPGVDPTPPRGQPAGPPPSNSGLTEETTVVTTTTIEEPGGTVVEEEEIEEETTPAVTAEQRQADIADCYAYAWSQVKFDEQVQNDTGYLSESSVNPGLTVFTKRLDNYGNEKRRGELFDSCMESKGYTEDY